MFLPFTAIFGEILFDDPISSVGFGIVFLELTSKIKIVYCIKCVAQETSKCVARKAQNVI